MTGIAPAVERVVVPEADSFVVRQDDYPWRHSVWNCHREVEIHLITRSHGTQLVGDHVGEFAPGQLVIVGSWLPHDWVSYRGPEWPIRGRDLVVQFDPVWISGLAATTPELTGVVDMIERSRQGLQFGGPHLDDARAIVLELPRHSGARRLGLLIELLGVLAAADQVEVLSSVVFEDNALAEDYRRTQQAILMINSDYATPLQLAEVAAQLGVRADYLSKVFRRNVGYSFSEYLMKIRLNRACHLLRTTKMKVSEVGFESGFSNLSNFNRLFVRQNRMTPREFRRSIRSEPDRMQPGAEYASRPSP